jgi:hypothetical protein
MRAEPKLSNWRWRIRARWALLVCLVSGSAIALAAQSAGPTTAPATNVPAGPTEAVPPWIADVTQLGQRMIDEDPLRYIAFDMKDAAQDLSTLRTDQPVQAKEQRSIGRLDELIARLQKQLKNGNGGSNPNPEIPMEDSRIAKGPGGSGPLHDARAGTKEWGQLPPQERQRILQSQNEGFPAGYESILASYYSRLAQDQATDSVGDSGSADAAAMPTTQPSRP